MILKEIVNNPFRMLGVCVNADARSVTAVKSKFSAFLRVGRPISHDLDLAKVLPPVARSIESLERAAVDVAVPANRLNFGQFWFFENDFFRSDALPLLADGKLAEAAQLLRKRVKSEKNLVDMQNLMIVCLLMEDYPEAVETAHTLFGQKKSDYQGLMTDLFSTPKSIFIERFVKALGDNGIDVLANIKKPDLLKWDSWKQICRNTTVDLEDRLHKASIPVYRVGRELADAFFVRSYGIIMPEDPARLVMGAAPKEDFDQQFLQTCIEAMDIYCRFASMAGRGADEMLFDFSTDESAVGILDIRAVVRSEFAFFYCLNVLCAAESELTGGASAEPARVLEPLLKFRNFFRLYPEFLKLCLGGRFYPEKGVFAAIAGFLAEVSKLIEKLAGDGLTSQACRAEIAEILKTDLLNVYIAHLRSCGGDCGRAVQTASESVSAELKVFMSVAFKETARAVAISDRTISDSVLEDKECLAFAPYAMSRGLMERYHEGISHYWDAPQCVTGYDFVCGLRKVWDNFANRSAAVKKMDEAGKSKFLSAFYKGCDFRNLVPDSDSPLNIFLNLKEKNQKGSQESFLAFLAVKNLLATIVCKYAEFSERMAAYKLLEALPDVPVKGALPVGTNDDFKNRTTKMFCEAAISSEKLERDGQAAAEKFFESLTGTFVHMVVAQQFSIGSIGDLLSNQIFDDDDEEFDYDDDGFDYDNGYSGGSYGGGGGGFGGKKKKRKKKAQNGRNNKRKKKK